MKPINISKVLSFSGNKLEIRYSGIPHSLVNLDKINKILDDFMKNHNHNDMINNVITIRSILRECEEKILIISCQNELGSERVIYSNSELFLYEKETRKVKMRYDASYGLKLDYNKSFDNLKEINEWLEKIYSLKNVKAFYIESDDKALIEIYKLFYNENPDFSKTNIINVKVQAMMSILAAFGIFLESDYSFCLSNELNMPKSLNLEQRVNKLYPLGEVDDLKYSIKLNEIYQNIIRIVGDAVRLQLANKQGYYQTLASISTAICKNRYNITSTLENDKLSDFGQYITNEFESNLKLAKYLENGSPKQ